MAVIPHPRQIQLAVVNWLDERFPFTSSVDEALYQRVPNYANAFYYCFGGMVFIMITVYLGWLIRGVHFWSANLLVIMIVLHMARVFWTGSYRAPRELNWMVGVIMLICVLAFALTGYLLPWDSKAYWASSVTIQIMGLAPILGGV